MSDKIERLNYSRAESAQAMSIPLTQWDDAVKLGHLKAYKVGRRWYTTRTAMEAYLALLQKLSDKGKPVVYRPRPEERRVRP
jgi:hypothetical protein